MNSITETSETCSPDQAEARYGDQDDYRRYICGDLLSDVGCVSVSGPVSGPGLGLRTDTDAGMSEYWVLIGTNIEI